MGAQALDRLGHRGVDLLGEADQECECFDIAVSDAAAVGAQDAGNMLAADAGANLRELMERMGHSTTRAATVYLHGGTERQQAIADELSRQAAEQLGRSKRKPSGTQRARRRRSAS